MGWHEVVLVTYLSLLGLLSLNGLHRLWMVWAWWRRPARPTPPQPEDWPRVTLQLPIFNERYVVERLIRACARIDYPRDRLQIQVLDDSTDDTTEITRVLVEELRAEGLDIELRHRVDRVGFKAGALDEGMEHATGEFIAIFDADFIPQPDFFRVMVPHFDADDVGMVQARWGHINAQDSWLTRAQATLLDGHFIIEHSARNSTGRWFNFNGTAGIWRRKAIADAGGWQHDTLTEDLDLSYRAQLKGWRFVYLIDVVAPAELPPTMAAFKSQQHRWAKGSVQTARKLLLTIWRADAPLHMKLEATGHLCANFSYPLVVLLSLLLPFAVYARIEGGATLTSLLRLDMVLFVFAVSPFILFYAAAIMGANSGREGSRLMGLPSVLALGLGMAVSQTKAVLEGLFGQVGVFVRTPKSGGVRTSIYRAATRGLVGIEALFALYLGLACVYVVVAGYAMSLPFLLLFAAGYGAVALGSVR